MTDAERYDAVIVGGNLPRAPRLSDRRPRRGRVHPPTERLPRKLPGFPAGVSARRLLDLMLAQAERAGAEYREAKVERVRRADDAERDDSEGERPEDRFVAETADGDRYCSASVVAATKNATDYLAPLDGVESVDRGKTFVATDERGRTGVEGVYAAGRLTGKPHQAVAAAGHGAEVAVTLLKDDDRPFYHNWVAPKEYFTGRSREVPPGYEEIADNERRRREAGSLETLREQFAKRHPEDPEMHPSVAEDDE